jgi:hypothetical protein
MTGLPSAVFRTAIDMLKADAAVAAVLGDRIYDVPPPNAKPPYLYLGPGRVQAERAWDCAEAWRFTFRLYVVSEAHDRLQAWDAIFAAVRALDRRKPAPPPGHHYPMEWEAAQGGDIIDPLKLKECFADVVAVVAVTDGES